MTPRDLPQNRIKVQKEDGAWFWVHSDCSLSRIQPRVSYPHRTQAEAQEGALTHACVHGVM